MVPSGSEKIDVIYDVITASNGSTNLADVDTKGYDYLQFTVGVKSGSAAETALSGLRVCESDSAITAYTDGTAVTALVGAAAVSTSAGFVLPARSSTTDNLYQLNLDLRGRKRYIACEVTPTLTCTNGSITIHTKLSRAEDSSVIAAIGTATAGCRLYANG